ncbi:hypothetical protein ACH5RR_015577 [Cinchona calisaya]|uniref:Uncharacterized protein n=1 Tax=Cinchona calisaya TaxID=153742 RepID=A0ABD2ZUS6_9GENT
MALTAEEEGVGSGLRGAQIPSSGSYSGLRLRSMASRPFSRQGLQAISIVIHPSAIPAIAINDAVNAPISLPLSLADSSRRVWEFVREDKKKNRLQVTSWVD